MPDPPAAADTTPSLPLPGGARTAAEPSWRIPAAPDARLVIRYELQPRDYWRGSFKVLRRLWRQLLLIVLLGGVLLSVLDVMKLARRRPPTPAAVLRVVAGSTLHLTFWYSALVVGMVQWGWLKVRRTAGPDGAPVTTTTLADSGVVDESGHQTIRMAWAEVTAVEVWGGGNVTLVRRRAGRAGPSIYIPRNAFADEAAARRFADAAELLRAGRGAEIPAETRREFPPEGHAV